MMAFVGGGWDGLPAASRGTAVDAFLHVAGASVPSKLQHTHKKLGCFSSLPIAHTHTHTAHLPATLPPRKTGTQRSATSWESIRLMRQ